MPAIAWTVTAAALQEAGRAALRQLEEQSKTAAPITIPITVLMPKRRFSDPALVCSGVLEQRHSNGNSNRNCNRHLAPNAIVKLDSRFFSMQEQS